MTTEAERVAVAVQTAAAPTEVRLIAFILTRSVSGGMKRVHVRSFFACHLAVAFIAPYEILYSMYMRIRRGIIFRRTGDSWLKVSSLFERALIIICSFSGKV